jgi:hypothetical protein
MLNFLISFYLNYLFCVIYFTCLHNKHNFLISKVRFMVLDVYGGIYIDGDVIYLKDMQIFREYTFAYRWSDQYAINTAIMGLNRAQNNHDLYSKFISDSNSLGGLIRKLHPRRLSETFQDVLNFKGLDVMHVSFFDPAWYCNDERKDKYRGVVCKFKEFTNKEITQFHVEDFFPGSFAYHIHLSGFGKWSIFGYELFGMDTLRINNFSYFYHFENYFSTLLKF